MKKCSKCGEMKSLSEYHRDHRKNSKKTHVSRCKVCAGKYFRNHDLKRNYNITLEDFNRMFAEQEGCCAICHTHQSECKGKLNVDHNHETGQVRALLCGKCNRALGLLQENKRTIKNMLDYVEHYNG